MRFEGRRANAAALLTLLVVAGTFVPGPTAAVSPYPAAIGRVERADGGSCTGTLVAPDTVLTAAHCVYTRQGRLAPSKLRFAAGRFYDQAVAVAMVTRIRLPAGYRYRPRPGRISDLARDVALLEVDASLGVAPLPVRRADGGATFDSIGYAAPFTEEPRKQPACKRAPDQRPSGVWGTTCFAVSGASGAPLLTVDKQPAVVGMIVARHKRTSLALSSKHISSLLKMP